MNNFLKLAAATLFGVFTADVSPAGPITREESQRQAQVLEQLKKALSAETTDTAKFNRIARVMKDERDVNLRRRILDMAAKIPGPELEKFLTNLFASDEDAGVRSLAATTLGLMGSEKCL